jgi:ubiquinone biosynthesis protein COQ9
MPPRYQNWLPRSPKNRGLTSARFGIVRDRVAVQPNWRVEAGARSAHNGGMSGQDFDHDLIAAAFKLAAETGWARLTIIDAARAAGLPLGEARARFPGKHALLRRFGAILDQAALAASSGEGPVRDRLFDLLMGRFDAMKPHREGLGALLRSLPGDPATALILNRGTRRSMRWMLQAAGVSTFGLRGELRVRGLIAVWIWAMRAFTRDETEDLAPTMAALDKALSRADAAAAWLGGERVVKAGGDEPMADEEGSPPAGPAL